MATSAAATSQANACMKSAIEMSAIDAKFAQLRPSLERISNSQALVEADVQGKGIWPN